jgi:LysM repeat protein
MLPAMEVPKPALASPASATIGDLPARRADTAVGGARAVVHVCPFLIADSGDWRLAVPTREHRCAALVPLASLTFEKQARLCLTAAHESCATYGAALAAREERTGGAIALERAGRWSFALTTPLIEDAGGVRSRVGGILADRRRWPVVPVVVLVATLFGLSISGARNDRPVTAVVPPTQPGTGANAAPAITITAAPTITPAPASASPAPTPTSTPAPSPSPTVAPTPKPTPAYWTTYTIKYRDTLSGIAATFHTTVLAIERLNGITDPTRLRVGQVIKIPWPG